MTKLKQQILDMMNSSPGHLSAEEVFLLAKKKKIDVSLASTYRILNKLVEDGLLSKFAVSRNSYVFDKTIVNHEHLLCDKCGKIIDIDIKGIKDYIEQTTKRKIDKYDLCIHYVCEQCKRKNR